MGRPFGSRTLFVICAALVILLGALAVVQYRWSARVAAADAQREKEHLDAAATLFAGEFNGMVRDAVAFVQNEAEAAMQSGAPLASRPKLIAALYYLDIPEHGATISRQLTPDGRFVDAAVPQWAAAPHCAAVAIAEPLAFVTPIYDRAIEQSDGEHKIRIMHSFRQNSGKCFVTQLDRPYLDTLLPQLIRRSFGATAAADYDFAVTAGSRTIYGSPRKPDLRRPFFSALPNDLGFGAVHMNAPAGASGEAIIVARVESTVISSRTNGFLALLGPGAWELQVAHKGMPLAAAFEQTRRRNLLLSLVVELLLVSAIAFLVVAARRMERLASQKMQFVAGVSHELRTPVSAIAMLSRNQADGLVTGPDRVRQYGELIHQQSRRLNEMVEQTLQYAGIRSGRAPARRAVDVRRLLEDVVEARRAELAAAGFDVELAVPSDLPEIQGDPQSLQTAIDNLLTNAQKHAVGGRWIRISALWAAPEKEVRISVEDRGAGIDPADHAGIFEPFSRGRAAIEAQIPGSGLGLSLVRGAAEAHRGTVTLVTEPGRGSTFTLHLPV
jgi:two-component system sensor histidine kinase SenX3